MSKDSSAKYYQNNEENLQKNFDDTKIEEGKFHHYKSPISINDIHISFFLVNKILNISLVTKIIKKLDLYAYYFQNIKDILVKLNIHTL